MGKLDGRIALVTGASSGIGRATAAALAAEGARVIAAARRRERVEALCREIWERYGIEAGALTVDVRDRGDVADSMKKLRESGWHEIDILVNNAGLAAGLDRIQDGSFDDWDRMIDTNVKGLLNVTRHVLPGMLERGRGHIVNIGSIAGREVYDRGNVYCATKFAVRALNKAMRIDLNGRGIRVTTVDPGLVETEFSLVRFHGDAERAKATYAGMTPLRPEDVADAVVWAVTRPPHVDVEEVVLMPTDQASVFHVHRRKE
ncbi:MAG: SDR family NAD(P)-dependent oxidoreductase [Acidobacteria bacterium]|nr:MAG: SDR family NAD(P)-dependent oxidoreductase [Acidobacteriota bacterium]